MADQVTKGPSAERHLLKYTIIGLIIVLVVLFVFLGYAYRGLRRAQVLQARASWLSALLHRHGPLGTGDAGVIRPWMTFDYIDRLFALPPQYLKAQLSISDARYPRLTVGAYANETHASSTAFLTAVQASVGQYVANPAASTSSASSSLK
jgi:hypothetical protein